MPIELEAKMKVADLGAVRQRLELGGAQRQGYVLEENIFFDTADRRLLAQDSGLRLRDEVDMETGRRLARLTHKGPRRAGAIKSRPESEVIVADAARMARVLEALGYRRFLHFQKKRESWLWRDCEVELDELPVIGTFVEIEGPNEPSIMQVRTALRLEDQKLIQTGYAALLTEATGGGSAGQAPMIIFDPALLPAHMRT